MRAHMGNESLGGEQDRFDVDGENAVELRLRHLHDRLVAISRAGVVDDDVHAAEGVNRRVRGALDVGAA